MQNMKFQRKIMKFKCKVKIMRGENSVLLAENGLLQILKILASARKCFKNCKNPDYLRYIYGKSN